MPDHLEDILGEISNDLAALREAEGRKGSSYVGPNADRDYAQQVAERQKKSLSADTWKPSSRSTNTGAMRDFLIDVRAAGRGDPAAHRRLSTKAWAEGDNTLGGYLLQPEYLPLVEARRASAPLIDVCRHWSVNTNEVVLVVEGDSVSVEHVPEAGTKPISTGSVTQKIATTFKAAGISEVSDELLMDAGSNLETMISRQFTASTFELIDKTIVAGTGIGEPTGILNTAGVTQTPVGAQDGVAIFESIITAYSEIVTDFYSPNVVAMRPELAPRFLLDAKATTGQYLYPGGIAALSTVLPGITVLLDPNIPNDLGDDNDETCVLVGDFQQVYYFERQPLTVESSPYPLWESDQTSFRAVVRYGAAVVQPTAFRVISGITTS